MSTTTQRPTPEVNAHRDEMHRYEFDEELALTYELAKRLECERDEARERADAMDRLHIARMTEIGEELEAMREAIKDAHYALAYVYNHGAGSCAFPFRIEDDLCSENRFHHVKDALDALQPFLKP